MLKSPRTKAYRGSAMMSIVDRLLDAIFGRAYRKFGVKRYELRQEVRKLLLEAQRLIDPSRHTQGREHLIQQALNGLRDRVALLPARDAVPVKAAIQALESVRKRPPSFSADQARQEAWKSLSKAAGSTIGEGIRYFDGKLRV